MRQKYLRKMPLAAAFLIPLLITIIICIDHEIYPFGNQCMLQVDMYHQYCPFFTELMEKIKSGGSLSYSWNIGLGADFVSLYAYYLASPLNWLIALCPGDFVIEFMTVLVVIKTALCGVTFTCYLKEHFGLESGWDGIGIYAAAVFGTSYALSAFMAAYAWNIMWLDGMVLAPLVILGLERLVKGGGPLLYYASLSVCILSNYYIAIMVCIFLMLWFFIFWLENWETGWRPWIRFMGYSLLAGGTGAILIIPTAIVLGYSGSQAVSFPETMEWYFNIMAELARHLVMTETYTGVDHWPNIYCGLFTLALFVLYLFNGSISWKRKLPRVLLAALFVVSFACNLLDFVWHGFRFPTSLPGRQSFLYIFLLLVIAFEGFLKLRKNKWYHAAIASVLLAAFLVAGQHFSPEEMKDERAFVVSAVFLGGYLILFGIYPAGSEKLRRILLGALCFAVVSELTLNYDVTGMDTVTRASYVENRADYRAVLKEAARVAKEQDAGFYRVEEFERKTKNDAALSGYHSATQFSSLMNLNVSHFYQDLGMEGGKNFYCASGATPLLSAMLSIRYMLADNDMEAGPLYTLLASSGGTYLYENAYSLPLGFMMSEETVAAWDYENGGDIGAQNALAHLLGSDEEMLSLLPSVSMPGESVVEADEDGYYFATYEKTSVNNLTAEVSSGRSRSYTKVSHNYILDLGYCKAGEQVTIKNGDSETVTITAYRLNLPAFLQAYDTLTNQTMELTSFSDTRVAGRIQVREAGRLIFSIAREAGWTLLVDGVETVTEDFGGAFLSVHLEPGEHEIELRYRTPGFALGAGISAGCAALAGVVMYARRRRSEL